MKYNIPYTSVCIRYALYAFQIAIAYNKTVQHYDNLLGQGWNKLWKTGKAKHFCSCSHYSNLPPLIGGTCPFCPPVEAMHAVTRIANYYL